MIKQLSIAAAIGLAVSGSAFAEGAKAQGSATGDTTANAIAQCDKLAGAEKANCLQQARRAADRSATGATSGSASGRAGANASASQPKDAAPSSPKAY